MADPRLQWRQVQAPDLSAASEATRRANIAFTEGMGAAQGILDRYTSGLQERADSELMSELLQYSSPEEFDQFVSGGGLEGRNLSPDMLNRLADWRAGLLDQSRVSTGIDIARAGEARTAAEYQYNTGRRDELTGLSGLVTDAFGTSRAGIPGAGSFTGSTGTNSTSSTRNTTTPSSLSGSRATGFDALSNDPEFMSILERTARDNNVSVNDIFGIINGESGFDPTTISPGGGYGGLFQLGTGTMYGASAWGQEFTSEQIAQMSPTQQALLYERVLAEHRARGWQGGREGLPLIQAAPAAVSRNLDPNIDLGTIWSNYGVGNTYWEANPGWRGENNIISPNSIANYYYGRFGVGEETTPSTLSSTDVSSVNPISEPRSTQFQNSEDYDFNSIAVGGAAAREDSFSGLQPEFRSRLSNLLRAAENDGINLTITSAYRSPELQAQLYESALQRYGSEAEARRWVAPPGRSQHNFGTAVDFASADGGLLRDANSAEAVWLRENAERFGLAVPMDWEPWQLELAGARDGNVTPVPSSTSFSAPMAPGQREIAALESALAGSSYLTPDDITGLLGTAYGAQDTGIGRIAELQADQQQRQIDALIASSLTNPNIRTENDMRSFLIDQGIDPSMLAGVLGQGVDFLNANSAFFNPQIPVSENDVLEESLAIQSAQAQQEQQSSITAQMLSTAEEYNEDPVSSILENFDITDTSVFGDERNEIGQRRILESAVQQLVADLGITPGQAAVAITETWDGGAGFIEIGNRRNTVGNRFDLSAAEETAERLFGDIAMEGVNSGRLQIAQREREIEQSRQELLTLQRQRERAELVGDRERAEALTTQIARIENLLQGGSSIAQSENLIEDYLARTGMASRLQSIDPSTDEGAAAYEIAIQEMFNYIQNDPTLSEQEKRALLSELRR